MDILSVCAAVFCSLGGMSAAQFLTEAKVLSEAWLFTCEMPPGQENASLERPGYDLPSNAVGIVHPHSHGKCSLPAFYPVLLLIGI